MRRKWEQWRRSRIRTRKFWWKWWINEWKLVWYFLKTAPFYIGKDELTKWLKHVPIFRGCTKRPNLVTHFPGERSLARNAETPVWNFSFLTHRVDNWSSALMNTEKKLWHRERNCEDRIFHGLSAPTGLLYLSGVKKSSRTNISEPWTEDGSRVTMSQRTLYTVLGAMWFNSIHVRNVRNDVWPTLCGSHITDHSPSDPQCVGQWEIFLVV